MFKVGRLIFVFLVLKKSIKPKVSDILWACKKTNIYDVVHKSGSLHCAKGLSTGMVCIGWYVMVWYGMVWYGMVWYGMVWYGIVWYGIVWFCMVWFGTVPAFLFLFFLFLIYFNQLDTKSHKKNC